MVGLFSVVTDGFRLLSVVVFEAREERCVWFVQMMGARDVFGRKKKRKSTYDVLFFLFLPKHYTLDTHNPIRLTVQGKNVRPGKTPGRKTK